MAINSNANSYHYTLSYRDDPSSTISIGWSGDDGSVYYGTTDHGTNYNLYSNNHPSDRVLTHKGQNRKFSRLTNLQPNTIYYFVIHDVSGYTSQRFKFHTLSNSPTSPVSFVSGGDSRDGFSLFGVYIENCPSGDCRQKRKDGKGFFKPAPFTQKYSLKTVLEKNNLGSWFGWEIEHMGQVESEETIKSAFDFYGSCKKGAVRVNHGKEEQVEKTPF